METFYIPTEHDIKKWVKEAMQECIELRPPSQIDEETTVLLNRREIAVFLRISLVTLTDWIKRGLPSHRQRGRIYFDKQEVLSYIKEKKERQFKVGSKLHHLKLEIG